MGFSNVTVYRILTRKNKVITLFTFLFLIPSLSYLNSITIGFVASGFVSCTGLWYSLCHILSNYCSSCSNKRPPPKKVPTLKAIISNKPHLPPPHPLHFLNVGIQENMFLHPLSENLWESIIIQDDYNEIINMQTIYMWKHV